MTTKELYVAISQKTGFAQKDIKFVLDSLRDTIVDVAKAEDEVKLFPGLTMCGVKKEARIARNPATGESVNVPSKIQLRAKVGDAMKRAIN